MLVSGGDTPMKKIMIVLMALVSAAVVVRTAGAQTFPSRPVKLAVPFPAGGGTDLLARVVAEALTKKWGQPVVVENLSGAASGNVGASEVARAASAATRSCSARPGRSR
jgi:tripartite-type tricarboxylate transporter receptor subunit TctC